MRITRYEPAHYPQMLRLAADMHAESPFFRDLQFDPGKVAELAGVLAVNPDFQCFVAMDRDTLVGATVVVVSEFFFGPDRFLSDLILYVVPERRGSTAGIRLLHAAEEWGKARGAVTARMGAATGINPGGADRFYTGLGYLMEGMLYAKPL